MQNRRAVSVSPRLDVSPIAPSRMNSRTTWVVATRPMTEAVARTLRESFPTRWVIVSQAPMASTIERSWPTRLACASRVSRRRLFHGPRLPLEFCINAITREPSMKLSWLSQTIAARPSRARAAVHPLATAARRTSSRSVMTRGVAHSSARMMPIAARQPGMLAAPIAPARSSLLVA